VIEGQQTLRIERTFQAPAAAVFDAWTSEAVIRRWQAERGWETSAAEVATTVRFTQSGLWDEAAVRAHEGGWGRILDSLGRMLAAGG
jgi:uncharacterized protein YndB with AHSA1/START domain